VIIQAIRRKGKGREPTNGCSLMQMAPLKEPIIQGGQMCLDVFGVEF